MRNCAPNGIPKRNDFAEKSSHLEGNVRLLSYGTSPDSKSAARPSAAMIRTHRHKAGFYRQMKAFAKAVTAGQKPAPPACLLPEAVAIMKVLEAAVGSEGKFRHLHL